MTKIVVLATLALVVTASSGTAAGPIHGQILGVVPHTAQPLVASPRLAKAIGAASPTDLTFDAPYQSVINQYFTDVAAASTAGAVDNVYAVDKQYSDTNTGNILYQSTFGGSYVDHDPLPANGCADGLDAYCLTDQQLEEEIQTVLTAKGWHGGLDHMFFLMTPEGVGSCFDNFSGQCTTNAFCAYHSFFVNSSNEDVIYANEPDMGPPGGCTDPQQGFPNDPDADTTVNTISHEHNEAITDPLTDNSTLAWVANDGSEIGDLCAYDFTTPPIGGTPGVDAYNQVINGHHYDLQPEYSNVGHMGNKGCKLNPAATPTATTFGSGPLVYQGGPVMHTNTTYAIYWLPTARNISTPVVTGTAIVNRTLTSSAGSWDGTATGESYQWQRCSSTGTGCADISGATARTYKLTSADGGHVVRSTVRANNVNGASAAVASTASSLVIDVPAATKPPHISGRAKAGKKLSGSHGSWTYSPTSYGYQWLRCNAHGGGCSSIRHATHPTYKLTKRDARHRLRVRVTAVNAAGATTATSSASPRIKR